MPRQRIQSTIRRNPDGSISYIKAHWRTVKKKEEGNIKKPDNLIKRKNVPHGDR
jgi:hypothetical protein